MANAVEQASVIVCANNIVGRHLTDLFLADGERVVTTSRDQLSPKNDKHVPQTLTITSDDDIAAFAAWCDGAAKVQNLIFLCGYIAGTSLADKTNADIDADFAINAIGPIKLVKALLPVLADGARVIFVSSISADNGSYDPTYAAAKAALGGFVKSMAKFCDGKYRVNIVAPGLIEDTTMFDGFTADRVAHHVDQTPTGELNAPADIAAILHELCQPKWRNLTGQTIHVNGGRYV